MGDFGYDDGLVHSHLWASQTGMNPPARRETSQIRHETVAATGDGYDDGLVHNHSWARNS